MSQPFTPRAALPWYDHSGTRSDLDAVWQDVRACLADRGIGPLPANLDHDTPYQALWQDARLILSQCCGLDLFLPHTEKLVAFAAPVVTAYDVPPGAYYSHIVTQASADLERPRVAINSRFSHSGHTAIKIWLANQHIGAYTTFESGSHASSLAALQAGAADVAAIDALSWTLLDTAGLQIIDASDPMPAPPFVMGANSQLPAEELTRALDNAFKHNGHRIGIGGVVPATRSNYHGVARAAAECDIVASARIDQQRRSQPANTRKLK